MTVLIERYAIEFVVERYGVLLSCFNLKREIAAINPGALSIRIHQFDALFLFVALKAGNGLSCPDSGLSTCWVKHHPIGEMIFNKKNHFLVIYASSICVSCDEVVCCHNVSECFRFGFDMPSTCLLSAQFCT